MNSFVLETDLYTAVEFHFVILFTRTSFKEVNNLPAQTNISICMTTHVSRNAFAYVIPNENS